MKGAKGKGTVKDKKEVLKPVDDKRVGKRKAAAKVSKTQTKKEKLASKDPNKPKKPASAFFVFMEEFRKTYKLENPDVKGVAAEKAPYEAKAAKRKSEYEKVMADYNKKQESIADDDDEESDKSKSEEDEDDEDEDEDDD
ncbi:hypothetical protein C5167_002469 [Papaver somniferum]|uniref:HMG box domain-containing protein n=1 Tax=Papaver somniferum TaxID=3469 RepID=A0A4Y7L1N1_PAPSO|nr:hypothetical protein C5167_002469 [Papaver somniferum]